MGKHNLEHTLKISVDGRNERAGIEKKEEGKRWMDTTASHPASHPAYSELGLGKRGIISSRKRICHSVANIYSLHFCQLREGSK